MTINIDNLPPAPTLVPELSVSDISASLAFYVDTLGFRILYQRPEEGFAYLERDGAELMVDQISIGRSWVSGAMEKPFGRGINLQLQVKDVETLRQQVNDKDIFLELETKWYAGEDVEYGVKQCIAKDPDGYLIRLQQSLGEKKL